MPTPYKKTLQKKQLRATPARLAILTILDHADQPLTVSQLQTRLKKHQLEPDPATLYRTLDAFEHKGLIQKLNLGLDEAYYETNTSHHHHFVCRKCKNIMPIDQAICEEAIQKLQTKHQINITKHFMEFFGRCANCQ